MNGSDQLDTFLNTDLRDVGCEQAMRMLHVYVDLVATGRHAPERHPGVAAHLRACGPCSDDFDGPLAAVRAQPQTATRLNRRR